MTSYFSRVIVSIENKGPGVRKGKRANRGTETSVYRARYGKAMLQIHTYSLANIKPCELQGTIMLSVGKAEELISTCLNRTGTSGYLGPGASMRILE